MSNKHIKKPDKFKKLVKTYSRKDTPHIEIQKHFENKSVPSFGTVDVESLPYVLDEDDDDSEITPVKQTNRIKPKMAPVFKPAHIIPPQNSLDSKSDLSTNVDLLDKKMQELNKQLFDIEKDIHTSFPASSNARFGTKSQKSSLSEDTSNKYSKSDFKKDNTKIDTRQIEQFTLPKIPDFKFHVTENDPSYNIRNEIMLYRQSIKDKQFEERIDKKLALLTGKCEQIQEKTYEDKQVGNGVEDGICYTEETSITLKRTPEEMSINTRRLSEESQMHVVSPVEERSDGDKSSTPRYPTIISALQEVDLVENFLTKTQKELSEIQSNFDDCLKSTSKLVSQSSHQLSSEVGNKTESTKLLKTGKSKFMPRSKSLITKPPLKNKESISQISNKGIKKNIKRKTPVTEPINKKIDKVRVNNPVNLVKYDCVFQQKDTRNRLEISVVKDDSDKIIESCPCRKECKSVANDPKPDIHLPIIKIDKEIQVEETDFTDALPKENTKPVNTELVGLEPDSRNNENSNDTDPVCAKLNKLSIHNMPKIEIRSPLVLHKMPNIIIPPQKTDSNTQNFSNIHYLEIKHDHKEIKRPNQVENQLTSSEVYVEEAPINNTPTNQMEVLNTIKEMPDEDSDILELLNNQSESDERISNDEESSKKLNLRQELNLENDSLPSMHSLRTIQNYLESKKTIIKENFLKYNVTNVKKMSVKTPLRSIRQRVKPNDNVQTSQITDKTNSNIITGNECSGKSESSNAVSELRKTEENISSNGSARPLCSKYDLEFQEAPNINLNKDTNNIKTDKSVCTYEFYSNKSVQCDFTDSKCKKLQISHVHFENIDYDQISDKSEKNNSKTSSIMKVPKNKHPPENTNVPCHNSNSIHSQSTSTKRQNVIENQISKNVSPNSILKNSKDNNTIVKRKMKSNGIENNKNLINNMTQTDKRDIDNSQDKQISNDDKKDELNYADDDTLNSSFESIPVHGYTTQTSIKDDDNFTPSSKLLPKVDDQKRHEINTQDNSKNNTLNNTFVLNPAVPSTLQDISKYSMNQYDTHNYSKDKFPVPVCSDLKGNVSAYRKRTIVTDSSISTTYESSEMNLSDGEVDLQCKCSLSMGEIHSCHCARKIDQGSDKLKAHQISSSDYSTQT